MTMTNDLPYRPCVGVMLINRQGHVFVGRRADRSGDPEEPLRAYADPSGHPFCIFVAHPPKPKPPVS